MPRALRMRPIEAAVIPFPSEEVTPPVTKTYFAMAESRACCESWQSVRAARGKGSTFTHPGPDGTPFPYDGDVLRTAWAAIRPHPPAPARSRRFSALALILAREGLGPINLAAVALVTAGVAGSQVFTGATNDLADQARDAILQPEKLPRR